MIDNLLIGADIELFVQHKETGEIISAENFILGTKDQPYNFDPVNPYFGTSKDNVLAEFTIPPTTTAEQWLTYISKARTYIDSIIPKEYCTVAFPAFILDPKWLQTEQAKIFGCEPDFNAYSQRVNIFPKREDENLRSAALHVHFGYDAPSPYDALQCKDHPGDYIPDALRLDIIKACDLFMGIPAVLIEPPNRRKELYGKAGAFRPKPYGVEYRTLGNYYLQSPELTLWVREAAQNAINWLNAGNKVDANLGKVVQNTIDNCDKEMAEYIINDFNLKEA